MSAMGAMTTHAPIATHAVSSARLAGWRRCATRRRARARSPARRARPTTAAHATACATKSGRAAASAASAARASAPRHQTWPPTARWPRRPRRMVGLQQLAHPQIRQVRHVVRGPSVPPARDPRTGRDGREHVGFVSAGRHARPPCVGPESRREPRAARKSSSRTLVGFTPIDSAISTCVRPCA